MGMLKVQWKSTAQPKANLTVKLRKDEEEEEEEEEEKKGEPRGPRAQTVAPRVWDPNNSPTP